MVLTRLPQEERLRFDVATQSSDFFTLDGRALEVLEHRIVMVNPRAVSERTPPRVRRWLELIEDSLDELVDERDYPEPALQKVLAAIEADTVSPQERYRYIEEAIWEDSKFAEREEGRREGLEQGIEQGARRALVDSIAGVAALLGLELTHERRQRLAETNSEQLRAVQERLLRERRWD